MKSESDKERSDHRDKHQRKAAAGIPSDSSTPHRDERSTREIIHPAWCFRQEHILLDCYLTKERKVDTMENTAKKLTLEEIKALPFASVIWHAYVTNDNGVIHHSKMQVVNVGSGNYGWLAASDEGGLYDEEITDNMLDDFNKSYWTLEPDDDMLPGITRKEFDELPYGWPDYITCPKLAEAITSRKITFEKICNQTGIDFGHFVNAMTGKEDFTCGELARIARELNTTVDDIFFGQKSNNPVALVQI